LPLTQQIRKSVKKAQRIVGAVRKVSDETVASSDH
jgi:hypothetical protein